MDYPLEWVEAQTGAVIAFENPHSKTVAFAKVTDEGYTKAEQPAKYKLRPDWKVVEYKEVG